MSDRRPRTYAPPPRFDHAQMTAALEASIAIFRRERTREPLEEYLRNFDEYRIAVDLILRETCDLSAFAPALVSILAGQKTAEALRYLMSPPISEDDLETVIDGSIAKASVLRDPGLARRIEETIRAGLDRLRFPWITTDGFRPPTASERDAAILATTALLASRRVETDRRHRSKRGQEGAVRDAILAAGFTEVPARTIGTLDDAPAPSAFAMESMLGSRKADLIVRLRDRRLLAIECKVSNSSLNSIKRLNNDAAVKARIWIDEFGTNALVPAAVLGGVFKLSSLVDAQAQGLTIFWEHDLAPLTAFLNATTPEVP